MIWNNVFKYYIISCNGIGIEFYSIFEAALENLNDSLRTNIEGPDSGYLDWSWLLDRRAYRFKKGEETIWNTFKEFTIEREAKISTANTTTRL